MLAARASPVPLRGTRARLKPCLGSTSAVRRRKAMLGGHDFSASTGLKARQWIALPVRGCQDTRDRMSEGPAFHVCRTFGAHFLPQSFIPASRLGLFMV